VICKTGQDSTDTGLRGAFERHLYGLAPFQDSGLPPPNPCIRLLPLKLPSGFNGSPLMTAIIKQMVTDHSFPLGSVRMGFRKPLYVCYLTTVSFSHCISSTQMCTSAKTLQSPKRCYSCKCCWCLFCSLC
jgi:hypothetical protein